MSDLVIVILAILATVRLTGLWLEDEIMAPARNRTLTFLSNWDERSKRPYADWLLTLLTCRWCVSVWIGLAVAAIAYYAQNSPVTIIVLLGLAASQVTGMLGDIGR